MTTEVSLSAARRLTLHFDGTSHLRLAWDEPDWLGPIGFMLAATPALAATLPPRLEPFGGSDDLGAYHGLGVAWDGLAVPLRMEVRAYADVPLLVFRLEALDRLGQLTTGSFEQPSVSWPAFQPRERMTGGVPAGISSISPISGPCRLETTRTTTGFAPRTGTVSATTAGSYQPPGPSSWPRALRVST